MHFRKRDDRTDVKYISFTALNNDSLLFFPILLNGLRNWREVVLRRQFKMGDGFMLPINNLMIPVSVSPLKIYRI